MPALILLFGYKGAMHVLKSYKCLCISELPCQETKSGHEYPCSMENQKGKNDLAGLRKMLLLSHF